MIINLLGTGGSEGIPNHTCTCRGCEEARKYAFARRNPPSVFIISEGGTKIVIDVGFDITPLLTDSIDAILLTHWHHDHITGLFKLRWTPEPVVLHAPSGSANREILAFPKSLKINLHNRPPILTIGDVKITAFPLNHNVQTFGYILEDESGALAVVFDTKGLPAESLKLLKQKKPQIALVDATFPPGVDDNNHNNLDEAIAIGENIAERVILTHIAHHNLPFTEAVKYIKSRSKKTSLAFDGMVLVI